MQMQHQNLTCPADPLSLILRIDNPNTTQTLEYTKDKYNVEIRK
jgi:hypothetical protein